MAVVRIILLTFAWCSPWQMAHAARIQAEDDQGDEGVTVRLLLTRHAHSCANAVDQFGDGFANKKLHVFMEDPMLTDCGVTRSKQGAERLFKTTGFNVDLVLSSSMLRAMETAAFMFPNNTIVPCPYISEKGIGADNIPKDVSAQFKALKTDAVHARKGLTADRLDMQFMESGPFSGAPRQTPSWSDFTKFMAEVLLPGLPEHLRKKELTIAVVTHSHFLRQIPELVSNCKSYYTDKPKNNQVFELKYRFTAKLMLQQSNQKWDKSVYPYTKKADALQQIQIFMGEINQSQTVFTNLFTPISRPWEQNEFSVAINRQFTFESDSGCLNLIDVPDKDKHMCKMDFGKVCSAELQVLSWMQRPRLEFIEQIRSETEKKIQNFKRKGHSESAIQAEKELVELQNFKCCTM